MKILFIVLAGIVTGFWARGAAPDRARERALDAIRAEHRQLPPDADLSVRRELLTRYQLLRRESDPDLEDAVSPHAMRVVRLDAVKIDAVSVRPIDFHGIDLSSVVVDGWAWSREPFRYWDAVFAERPRRALIRPNRQSRVWWLYQRLRHTPVTDPEYTKVYDAYWSEMDVLQRRRQVLARRPR